MLLVPESGRYRVEPTMAAMLADLFDHYLPAMPSDTHGRPLKWHVARKIVIAAVCCHLKPEELCLSLNLQTFPKFSETNVGVGAAASKSAQLKRYNAVGVEALSEWFCGRRADAPVSVPDNMPTKEDVESGNAYVLLNASGAPYADIIFVAKGIVILFQVKESALSKDELYEDVAQCGMMTPALENVLDVENTMCASPKHSEKEKVARRGDAATQHLCDLAGISMTDVVLVVVCSNGFTSELNLDEFPDQPYINLCAKAPQGSGSRDFMYPLAWPHATGRARETGTPSRSAVVE